ncbi:MAG: methyltransferase domain-containing protein [Pseudomonadota bacterium]
MSATSPPALFDLSRIEANRDRASFHYRNYAFLKARESSHFIERLEDVSRHFPRALELGSHDGQLTEALLRSPQVDEVIALDPSAKMLARLPDQVSQRLHQPLEALNLPPKSLDLVASVLSLHWVNDLPGLMVQIRETLKPDGLLLGCLFGGGTLTELRTALIEAESSLTGGVSPRISPLPGLQDVAGLMQRTGFALPVVDKEPVTVRYSSPLKLLDDLRGMGEQAAFARREGQERRPLSRRLLMRLDEAYRDLYSDPDGKVRATFEVIWLSGWAPAPTQPKPLKPGSGKHSLADAVKGMGRS